MASASDNFNRADSTDLGTNWDIVPNAVPHGCQIVSNECKSLDLGSYGIESYNAITPAPDQSVQVKLTSHSNVSGADVFGVILRCDAASPGDLYQCIGIFNGGTTTEINKIINTSATTIASENATTWLVNDIIRAEVRGTTISVYRNGVFLLSGVDSARASGRWGVNVGSANGATNNISVDDWNAADFTETDYTKFPKPKIRDAALRGQI